MESLQSQLLDGRVLRTEAVQEDSHACSHSQVTAREDQSHSQGGREWYQQLMSTTTIIHAYRHTYIHQYRDALYLKGKKLCTEIKWWET